MISVIIPVYNEAGIIGHTIRYLKSVSSNDLVSEIVVVDGGSMDDSVKEAQREGALVIRSSQKGRAIQMNEGASASCGSVLYFLHADSLPPKTFAGEIQEAVRKGFTMGCYRLRFDLEHWFLRANAWFTRFDFNAFRYGDQSLFVTRQLFNKAGGFSEEHLLMEDHEIVKRLRTHGNFVVLPNEVITSARKYRNNGIFKTQGIFYLIYLMYQLGYTQEKLLSVFRKLIRQDRT